jgi:hypothetical protein
MGGAVGSIKHIWDFDDLTFSELLEVFEGILEGSVQAVEKTDGLPIVWRWTGEEVLWARSTSDVRGGGYSSEEFKTVYSAFPGIALLEAGIDFFEANIVPKLEGMRGFSSWIDSELFSPESVQLVPSEIYAFIVHRSFTVDQDTTVQKVDVQPDPFPEIRRRVGKVRESGFDVSGNETLWSFFVSADSPSVPRDAERARSAIRKIESELKVELESLGLGLNQSINAWVQKEVHSALLRNFTQLEDQVLELASYLAANPDAEDFKENAKVLKGILKEQAPEFLKELPVTKAIAKEMKLKALEPIKRRLKVLGAEFISELQPVLVTPENYETIRREMRLGVEAAIEVLETAEDDEMKSRAEKAARNAAIVTGNEHLIAPYEGFVVSRGDDLMKVTGIFPDAGTIKKLGTRKSIAEIDWENADTVISVFPMAAKPAHAGHWDMIEGISRIKPVNPITGKPAQHLVKLIVSEGARSRPGEVSISAKQALIYWTEYLKNYLPENVKLISAKNMYVQIEKEVVNARSQSNVFAVWVWSGDKDAGRFSELTKIEGVSEPSQKQAEEALGRPTTNVSGTRMRQALGSGDMDFFMRNLPAPLSQEEREEIWVLFAEEL